MASKPTFGQLLRYFRARGVDRERGRKLTQERLGELIGAKLGIESGLKGATISGWELGDKRPYSDDRSILIALVQTLYECEGIRAIEEANQLLEAGDYRALNDDEITHCGFPSSPSLPAPIPEPSSEESCTWTWQAGLWLAFLALDLIGLAGLCYLLLSGMSLLARDVALVAIGALLALAGVLEIPARGEHFCALGKALYERSPLRFGVIALLPVILILWVTVGRNVYCQVYPCGEHIVLVETFDGRDLEHDDVDEAIGLTEARLRQLLRRTQSLHVMNEVDDFTASQIDFRIIRQMCGKRILAAPLRQQFPPSTTGTDPLTATSSRVEQRIQADLTFAKAQRLLGDGDRDVAIARWLEAAALYREFDRLREAEVYLAMANAYSPFPVGSDEPPDLTKLLAVISQDPNRLLSDLESAMEYYNLAFLAASDAYEELCARRDCFPDLNAEQVADANILYQQGLAAYEAGRHDDAISGFQDAASTYSAAGYPPGQVRALFGLSQAYFIQDPLWGATRALPPLFEALILIEEFPLGDATDVRYLEGLHAYEQGRFHEAITIWTEVIPQYNKEGDDRHVAVTRTNLGNAYVQSGDYPQVLALYAQALPAFEALEDVENQATVHHNWGNILLSQGNYPAALERYELALSGWRAIGDRLREAASLDGAGFVLTQLGHHEEAEVYLTQALDFQWQLNDRPGQADSLTNLGNLDIQQSRYAQAEDYFNQALTIWREERNQAKEVPLLSNLSAAQTGAGKVDQALITYDEALWLADAMNDRLARAHVLINRGNLHANLGDAQTALGHYYQALAIFEEYDNRAGVAMVTAQLGQAYLMVSDLRRAQTYLERALDEAEATGHQANIANVHYTLGAFWILFPGGPDTPGDTTQAETHLQAALSLWENLENQDGQTQALNHLSHMYQVQGHYEEALVAQTRALELAAGTGNRLLQVRAMIGLGLIQVESGETNAAQVTFEEARSQAAALNDVRGELLTFVGEGYTAVREEDPAAALAAFQQAIDRLEQWHGLLVLPELKMMFLDKLADLYDLVAYLAYQQGQSDIAFQYIEQGKARTLLEQLANLHLRPSADLDPNLVSREAKLRGEIARLFGELNKVQGQAPSDQARLDDLGDQLEKQRRAYADLLLEIRSQDPTFQNWRHPSTLSLTEIQSQFLAEKEITLLEYSVSPLGMLAWVVEGESVTQVALDVDEATLVQKVSYWHDLVTSRNQAALTASQEIYSLVFDPLRSYIHHSRLIVVPHGSLHRLALAALHDGERYLVEEYTISYLPSASSLPFLWHEGASVGSRALVLGDPDGSLPHSADEARAVANLYGVAPLLGDQATEQAVKRQDGDYDLLHLAAHGVYQSLSPLFTRLELAASGGEDGLLEVHEIYNLNLAETDLVVLSACQSQEGKVSNGDEMLALNRAFLYAGAPAVVASLWPVEDAATAALMVAFHRRMQEGMGSGTALQAAQQSILADPPTAHPYYWAAFDLTGNPGGKLAATTPSDKGDGICGLSLALLLLAGSILIFRQRRTKKTIRNSWRPVEFEAQVSHK